MVRKHYYEPPSLLGENSCGDVLYDRSHAYGPRPDYEVGARVGGPRGGPALSYVGYILLE